MKMERVEAIGVARRQAGRQAREHEATAPVIGCTWNCLAT